VIRAMPDELAARFFQLADQVRLLHPTGNSATRRIPGDLSAGQVFVKIPQILLEFLKGFTLRQVVREFLKIAEPHALILPMDVAGGAHGFSVPRAFVGCGGLQRSERIQIAVFPNFVR